MTTEYRDKNENPLTRDDVLALAPEDLGPRSGVRIKILPDHEALYDAVAETMVETIESRGGEKTSMILPVGPVGQYPAFARKVRERNLDCRNLWTFNMDEFLDRNGRTIPDSHPMSFRRTMMENFYDLLPEPLRMPIEQMHFPRHDTLDAIDHAFDEHAPDGVDLCLAGVGPEGHVAFNEDPNFRHVRVSETEFLDDRTRLVQVNTSTVDMDALVASSGDRSAVPPFAVTIGPHDILRSRRTEVVFFAGPFQRCALRETLFRVPTMHFPGSLLRMRKAADGHLVHQNLTVWSTPVEMDHMVSQTV